LSFAVAIGISENEKTGLGEAISKIGHCNGNQNTDAW